MSEYLVDQAADVFVCELTRIDKLGCNRRLIFTMPSVEGGRYKHVQIKLIVPASYMTTMAYLIAGDGTTADGHGELALMEVSGEAN
jgi:hypothetical protein